MFEINGSKSAVFTVLVETFTDNYTHDLVAKEVASRVEATAGVCSMLGVDPELVSLARKAACIEAMSRLTTTQLEPIHD